MNGGELDSGTVEQPAIIEGKPPIEKPPRTIAYEELQKKIVDVLIDAIKYIASSCGITIALYSQILQGFIRDHEFQPTPVAKSILFAPLLLWLCVIISTICGIFPRHYNAQTDFEKQQVINKINNAKTRWLIISLTFFFAGFAVFIYIMAAQIWDVFPFGN